MYFRSDHYLPFVQLTPWTTVNSLLTSTPPFTFFAPIITQSDLFKM